MSGKYSDERRNELYERLSELSFYRRVQCMQEDGAFSHPTISVLKRWRRCWETATASELATLTPAEIQNLIDWCDSINLLQSVLPQLYNRRHELRREAMNNVREMLVKIPAKDRLNHLLLNESISIEHYPVELTKYATSEWMSSIDPYLLRRLLSLLRNTKLKIWKKVEAKLFIHLVK